MALQIVSQSTWHLSLQTLLSFCLTSECKLPIVVEMDSFSMLRPSVIEQCSSIN